MRLRTACRALAAAVVGPLVWPGSALSAQAGEAAPSAQLAVDRPAAAADCADAPALAAAVARVRGRDAFDTGPSSAAPARFDVAYTRSADGYAAIMRASGVLTGQRSLADRAGRCAALSDAVAVALAVMLDAIDVAPPPAAGAAPAPKPTAASLVPAFDDMPPVDPPAALRERAGPLARHSVFVELLGPGLFYSLNYEHFLLDGRLGLRAGAGYFPAFDVPSGAGPMHVPALAAFPAVASYYVPVRGSNHAMQLGAGATFLASRPWADGGPEVLGVLVWGYRYAPRSGGLDFGAGFTPLLGPTGSHLPLGFAATGALSLGARF